MSITKVQDFSGDSFDFEEPVGNRFGSESIGLVATLTPSVEGLLGLRD